MINVSSLCFRYKRNGPLALCNVSFKLEKGQICVLLGPNGAGKSTLLKLLLGIYKPSEGSIEIEGKSLQKMGSKEKAKLICYVPQSLSLPPLNVEEVILLGRVNDFVFAPAQKDKDAAYEAAEKLGITHLLGKKADELSGGEKQKVALARALAQGAEIMLFDEPTSNLDIASRKLTLELARLTAKEGKTVLLALHDLNDGLNIGDHFLFLKGGHVLANGNEEIFTNDNLSSLYGVKCQIREIDKKIIILWSE